MDASPIVQAFLLFVLVTATTRWILAPVARAGDGIATLFGPQTYSLGWPRGVQEIDEPWAWRTPQAAVVHPSAPPGDHGGGPLPIVIDDWVESQPGTFVVPVARVGAVRMGARPH